VSGNSFDNDGRIVVRGDGNGIDMGPGLYTLLARRTPLAFVNDGTIDFHDGAADDVLRDRRRLRRQGEIIVDVSGLQGASDLLYIEGNVVAGTEQAIDVYFSGLPTTASSSIAIVPYPATPMPGTSCWAGCTAR
jgi:hypothetical protein